MRQRGITELEVEHILKYPSKTQKSYQGRIQAIGLIKNRRVKVVFFETESYIKIITVV
mgnify:CR=1 FL=1